MSVCVVIKQLNPKLLEQGSVFCSAYAPLQYDCLMAFVRKMDLVLTQFQLPFISWKGRHKTVTPLSCRLPRNPAIMSK